MRLELSPAQQRLFWEFRDFAESEVQPKAAAHDRNGRIEPDLLCRMARCGYFIPILPKAAGGRGFDLVSYVLLHEQIGRACASLRSVLTVHDMAAYALFRFGNDRQLAEWLPDLASGRTLAAFALTEAESGSEIAAIATTATREKRGWRLNGQKSWISLGQSARLFLVFARTEQGIASFLVGRDTPGLTIEPSEEVSGLRGAMLAELRFSDCLLDERNLIGRPDRGHPQVTAAALTLGRLGVAAGCVGLLQACADAGFRYSRTRRRAGVPLARHQLIAAKLADIYVAVDAARLLTVQAAILLQESDPRAVMEVAIAKHFAATMVVQAARETVQIHGAKGCSKLCPVERYYRDAKIMEIVEGTNELQQLIIGDQGYAELPSFFRPSLALSTKGSSHEPDQCGSPASAVPAAEIESGQMHRLGSG